MFFIKWGLPRYLVLLCGTAPICYITCMNIYYSSIGSLDRLGMLLNCSKGTG